MNLITNIIPFILSTLISQVPENYVLSEQKTLTRYEDVNTYGLNSNSIVDIRKMDKSYLLISTSNGLSYAYIENQSNADSVIFGTFSRETKPLPRGGMPALVVKENIVAVSGIMDTSTATGQELMGTGISYSLDEGESWNYLSQSIDYNRTIWHCPSTKNPNEEWYFNKSTCSGTCYDEKENLDECKQLYQWIQWGEQDSILSLLITTEINNISYDLAVGTEYIYAASWAGGLRRYGPLYTDEKSWQIIPLPMDSVTTLMCGFVDSETYELNPNDPDNGGNHNHKAFSVYILDNTIWVGTANGINKGQIESDCINWSQHYTASQNDIAGNWVIGFIHQELGNINRIWAITWAVEGESEANALSYTDDGGATWHITYPVGNSEKVYNLYTNENRIWAATESGLYVSENGEHWEKYIHPIDTMTGEELLTESVMAVYYQDDWLWAGTIDGISIINEKNDIKTTIHRFWEKSSRFSVYPNPFLINDYNQIGIDGFVRFIFSNYEGNVGIIDIFDFSMDKIIQLKNQHMIFDETEMLWNGRNQFGDKVANGVYFCRLSLAGQTYWTKLAVIN